MRKIITDYLEGFDLDVRKSGDARFMDQKCTPDVLCFIADCIANVICTPNKEFVVKDIWNSQYFIRNARALFGKPLATSETARHEYDKFIQQPLRLLAYAHVLSIKKKGNSNVFTISNMEILEYIGQRERNAYNFLYCYLYKVLSDSNMIAHFNHYIERCGSANVSQSDYVSLRDRCIRFFIGHTRINGDVEVRRIFPKILNIFSVEHNIPGSEKGRMSKYAFTFSDLMYNRKNWRDLNKPKDLTRQEAEQALEFEQQEAYNAYNVQKAMARLRKIQLESEVHDQWANGEATQIHHIFPKSMYPQIAHYIENLIKLTATQHYTKAHPNNQTQIINQDYQLTCLLAKADTIEKSISVVGERYYSKDAFIFVLNTGLTSDFSASLSFREIKRNLIHIYNS